MKTKTDVLIVGSGVAGLYCALKLPRRLDVMIITKADPEECDSYLAQGGICMLRNEDDYESYFEDTLRAGHYENNRDSVETMIRSSQNVIEDLLASGVDFERDETGELRFTREAAHSHPRILYHQDTTGKEITSKLLQEVRNRKNVTLCDHVTMLDIIETDQPFRHCQGIIAAAGKPPQRSVFPIEAKEVVWACGGIGGLYEHSTNFSHLTGDALGIALRHHIPLLDPDYIQIHPTTLYTKKKGRAFLISESVRGEGGILLNRDGKRFTDELQPRDVVSQAIYREMKRTGEDHVWLSMEKIPAETIRSHFKNIWETCLQEGYDCTKEPIPVVPAQHYFMGGVRVDLNSRTSLPQLYAIGETSCNGVHGANRLASNSLLESLVFAGRAAKDITQNIGQAAVVPGACTKQDLQAVSDETALFAGYKKEITEEIERMRLRHEQDHYGTECGSTDTAGTERRYFQ